MPASSFLHPFQVYSAYAPWPGQGLGQCQTQRGAELTWTEESALVPGAVQLCVGAGGIMGYHHPELKSHLHPPLASHLTSPRFGFHTSETEATASTFGFTEGKRKAVSAEPQWVSAVGALTSEGHAVAQRPRVSVPSAREGL